MAVTFSRFDVVDYLTSEEDMIAYLEACFEEAGDDAAFISAAIGDVARARGLDFTSQAGLSQQDIQELLSKADTVSFQAILKALRALGLKLMPKAA